MVVFYIPTLEEMKEEEIDKKRYSGVDVVDIDDLKKFIGKIYLLNKEDCCRCGTSCSSEFRDSDFWSVPFVYGKDNIDIIKVVGIKIKDDIVYFETKEAQLIPNSSDHPSLWIRDRTDLIPVHTFLNECCLYYQEIDPKVDLCGSNNIIHEYIWEPIKKIFEKYAQTYENIIKMICE